MSDATESAIRPAGSATPAVQTRTRAGSRRRRVEIVQPPLGSLTQRDHRHSAYCAVCGSVHVTRLSMNLTDGTPVDFTSCHRCEHRQWESDGAALTVETVLDSTRKV